MSKVILAMLLVARTAQADAGDRWDSVMILEQVGGGVFGGAVGATAGVGLGLAIDRPNGKMLSGLVGAFIGGSIGAAVGITAGVKISGEWRGGNGSWLATGAGMLAGGLLTVASVPAYKKLPTLVVLGLFVTTMIAPPIIAYHLSTDEHAADDHEARVMMPLMLGAF